MIRVEHLTRRFGRVTAVDDVSFRLGRGEVVGFLGPNGAGKTTIMRMLCGFLPPSRGTLEVAGFDVLRRSLEVRSRIGYLPESVPLYRELRVVEMLRLQARLHRVARTDRERRIGAVLERVGLPSEHRKLVGHLSKGQRQRVGLAVALLPEPEVLVLDEPTSGLDPLQRIEVRGLVRDLARERTVLLSSHILPEVEAVCPRVIVLHRGRIAADGTPAELVRQLGSAACVRVEARLGEDDVRAAERLLGEVPGAVAAAHVGDEDGYSGFEVRSEADLRPAMGALAARRGWTLRELSRREPSLEELFARIALGLDEPQETAGVGGGEDER